MIDYEKFITQLRQPAGEPLKIRLQTFLSEFRRVENNINHQRKLISGFLVSIFEESLLSTAFRSSDEEEFDDEHVREGWEKLVMTKVFESVFAPNTEEKRSNKILAQKIETYSWLEERHLDLNINFSLALEVVQAELLRINGFRSPRDKLTILQNVMQLIVDLIKKRGDSENNDNILPTLILVIIRASPPNLISNIKYITRFRNQTEMEKGNNQVFQP